MFLDAFSEPIRRLVMTMQIASRNKICAFGLRVFECYFRFDREKHPHPGLLVLKERPESMLNTALWPKSSRVPNESLIVLILLFLGFRCAPPQAPRAAPSALKSTCSSALLSVSHLISLIFARNY
jgi:hypothetical protein